MAERWQPKKRDYYKRPNWGRMENKYLDHIKLIAYKIQNLIFLNGWGRLKEVITTKHKGPAEKYKQF